MMEPRRIFGSSAGCSRQRLPSSPVLPGALPDHGPRAPAATPVAAAPAAAARKPRRSRRPSLIWSVTLLLLLQLAGNRRPSTGTATAGRKTGSYYLTLTSTSIALRPQKLV